MVRGRAVAGGAAGVVDVAVGVRRQSLEHAGGVRRVLQRGDRLRELAQGGERVHVVAQAREPVPRDPVDLLARLVAAARHREHPRVAGAVGVLGRAAALALDRRGDHERRSDPGSNAACTSGSRRRAGRSGRSTAARRSIRPRRRRSGLRGSPASRATSVPTTRSRQPQPLGERLMRVDLGPHRGEVAALEVVETSQLRACSSRSASPRSIASASISSRGGEPLVEVLRAPQRRVASVERVEQFVGPRERHRLVAERLALLGRRLVVGLDRQPRDEPCAQRGFAARAPPRAGRPPRGRRR